MTHRLHDEPAIGRDLEGEEWVHGDVVMVEREGHSPVILELQHGIDASCEDLRLDSRDESLTLCEV